MADTYNVFISWSGGRSKAAAEALRLWLRSVLQAARPWMSETDIDKGSRGLEEVGRALEGMKVGIICLTPENLSEPWILFEAGALSKTLDARTRVCTYLLGGLRPENVTPPLSMFQWTKAERDDTRKLLHAVNKALDGFPVPEKNLDDLFEGMWPQLQKQLAALPAAKAATPDRSEREMLAELLELSRGSIAGVNWSKEALTTLIRVTNRLIGRAGLPGELADKAPRAEPTYEELKERVLALEELSRKRQKKKTDDEVRG